MISFGNNRAARTPAIPAAIALLLGWCVSGPAGFAQDAAKPVPTPVPSKPPPYREMWVPTEHLDAVLARMPRAVMLTPEQYRTLLLDAERAEKPEDPALKAPVAALIRDVVFDGELTNDVARITARYSVESFTDEWSEIPLVLPRARLAHIEVDDQSAIRVSPPAGKGPSPPPVLVVRGKGEHAVSAEFYLPVSRSPAGNAIQFPRPGIAAASMKLTVPDGARLDSTLPFVTGEEDPNTAKFVLPAEAGPDFEIRWTARNIDAIPDAAVFQTCSYLYSIDSTRVQADLGLVLSSSLAELPNRFQIVLPDEVRILSVEGSELLSWDAIATDSGTGIEVVLVAGKRQAADIRILAEADVAAEADADVAVVLPIAEVSDVHRASGTMALIGSDDVRVKNITTGPLTVAAPEALEAAVRDHPDFVAGFRFPVTTTPPEITLSPVQERFNVQLDSRIELKREAIHLTRNLTVIPLEGRLFETEIELPAGEELLSVAPAAPTAGFSWTRSEGNRVRLAWQQGLIAGDNPPALTVVSRLDPENWFDLSEEAMALTFANAVIADAETVSGYVAVAFDESFRVETVTADGLESRDARTTPVSGALAWFRIADYALELNAARRATEVEATVTAYALPLQSSLEIEGQLDLEIRYTPISEVVVKLDPAVAEFVRWDSPLLAEKRLDETTGEWTLDFHEEQSGFQRLRFRMALPFELEKTGEETEQKRFAVSAPVFSVPGAKRVRGDWIIEANTDTELTFEANGVDSVDSLRVPAVSGYQPRHRVIAAYQFRGDAYELEIAGTRHAPEELVTTVVDSLRLDTVVSTDGPDRHQARISLRTSGEQFLEIALPEGAVVWTLTVDGEAVKPVSVQDAPDTLRVQLPAREDAGRQSIALKLIYQTQGKKWGGSGREKLEPIRLAGRIPVMRSDWFLHLPEGFDYQRFKSNLQESFEVIDRTLLGQVWEERDRFLPELPSVGYAKSESAYAAVDTAAEMPAGAESENSEAYSRQQMALESPGEKAVKEAAKRLNDMELEIVRATPTLSREPSAMPAAPVPATTSPFADATPAPSTNPESGLKTQVYKVPPGFLNGMAQAGGGAGAAAADPFAAAPAPGNQAGVSARKTARDVLEAYGVNFGPGASATYDPSTGNLIVRNNEDQLNVVGAVTTPMGGAAGAAPGTVTNQNGTEFLIDALPPDAQAQVSGVTVDSESGESVNLASDGASWNWGFVIPEFKVENKSLPEAVNLLGQLAEKQAGQPGGHPASPPPIHLNLDGAVPSQGLTLDFKNVPFPEALRRITEASGTEYQVTASGVAIVSPGTVPPDSLESLVLELPNSVFETSDGSGGVRRMSARNLLTASGVEFPPGTSAAYNRTTGRLAVRNTSANLATVRELFASQAGTAGVTTSGAFAATGRGGAGQVLASAQALGLKGFDFRNTGLIPLDFELPQSGRSYSFSGLYAPEPIKFRYVNWERQIRFAWFWILVGVLGFWFAAVKKFQRPIVIGVLGVIVLTFVPLIISQSLLAFCNSLLIGWLLGGGLWLAWKIRTWLGRVFASGEAREAGSGEEAAATA